MADELHDQGIELANLQAKLENQSGAPISALNRPTAPDRPDTRRLAKLARQAEDIAASLDQP